MFFVRSSDRGMVMHASYGLLRILPRLALASVICGALAAQTPTQLPGQTASATPAEKEKEKKEAGAQPGKTTGKANGQTTGQTGGEDQQLFEIKVGANHTKINPNIRDEHGRPLRSFLTPGKNVTADFSYFQDHTFGSNRLQVLSIVRSNNDPRVDPEQNSLQRGYAKITTPNSEWNFGDSLVSFSRLTFNQNIKGLNVTRKFGNGFRLTGNGGVFTDRWGSMWKDDLIGKPFTRVVAGMRAEERFTADKIVGLNFSHGRDMNDSIRADLRQFGLIPLDNQIGSVDGRFTFGRVFTVDGELGYSATNFDTTRLRDKRKDYGGRLDTSLRAGRFFARTSYTRLMPSFLAINARQLADLQDALLRGGLDLSDNVTVEASYRRTNNNLRDERPEGTTVFRAPEVRVSFRRLPGLGRTIIDAGYRERQQEGPARLVAPLAGRREERTVRIPFVDVSIPLGNTLLAVGYEHRENVNRVLPSENTGTNRWSGSFRSTFDLGGWNISPMFRYEMEREEFFRVLGFNNNRNVLASLFIDAPKYVALEGMYRVIGATLFAECLQQAGGAPCSPFLPVVPGTTVLLPSGFRRPAFRAALTYKLFNSENKFIVFAIDRSNNFFALPGRDFDERVLSVTLVYRFKR